MDPAYAWPAPQPLDQVPGWFRTLIETLRAIYQWLLKPFERAEGAGVPVKALLAFVVLVLLVHLAVRLTRQAVTAATESTPSRGGRPRDAQWYWGRAERFAATGAYGPAMLAAFHAAMLRAAAARTLSVQVGATPREWIERLKLSPEREARVRPVVTTLYRIAFAAEPSTEAEYRAWVRDLQGAIDAPAA